MIFKLQNLDRSTIELLPEGCRRCGWWQGYDSGWPATDARQEWGARAEELIGCWGKLAIADENFLGMLQFAPASILPRTRELSGGPPSEDAVLISCSVVLAEAGPAVQKSLLLAALSDLEEAGVKTVEAFCLRKASAGDERHMLDPVFLRDCGFYPVRSSGELQLMRLELGGAERSRAAKMKLRRGLLHRLKRRATTPTPVTPCRRREGDAAGVKVNA